MKPARLPSPDTRDKLRRAIWGLVRQLLFKPSPRPAHGWRRFLLRQFGAKVAHDALVYPDCHIYAPWNLEMERRSVIGDGVYCYNIALIRIERGAIVSQRTHLCTASHDMTDPAFPLIAAPIVVGPYAWIATEAFIGPGVTIDEGAVAGARAVVRRDVPPWQVVAGNPATQIRERNRQAFDEIEHRRVI